MNDHRNTVVLEVSGVQWASSKAVAESALSRRPGVVAVEANPVAQTANITYDPSVTSVAELRRWVTECGYHCAGQSVPDHICDPAEGEGHGAHHADHVQHDPADLAAPNTVLSGATPGTPQCPRQVGTITPRPPRTAHKT